MNCSNCEYLECQHCDLLNNPEIDTDIKKNGAENVSCVKFKEKKG